MISSATSNGVVLSNTFAIATGFGKRFAKEAGTVVSDAVEYELPLGLLGDLATWSGDEEADTGAVCLSAEDAANAFVAKLRETGSLAEGGEKRPGRL